VPPPIPEFGYAIPNGEYILRPGGYAVIFNAVGELAVLATPLGLFLPGGGQHNEESPQDAAIRETCEECGLQITLGARLGIADELVFAADENTYYRKRCVFFLGRIMDKLGHGEPDHELRWLSPVKAAADLLHESQRWAITQACQQRRASHD
jgi:8-oxo-dGTP diphosphatase